MAAAIPRKPGTPDSLSHRPAQAAVCQARTGAASCNLGRLNPKRCASCSSRTARNAGQVQLPRAPESLEPATLEISGGHPGPTAQAQAGIILNKGCPATIFGPEMPLCRAFFGPQCS
jgi:hypothetical protein